MNVRGWLLVLISMAFAGGVGPIVGHYLALYLAEIIGLDLHARPSGFEAMLLIIFLCVWYPIWCFIGFLVGLVVARPICGPASIATLESRGTVNVPMFSFLYRKVVAGLYQ